MKKFLLSAVFAIGAGSAQASICDWTPSNLLGGGGSKGAAVAAVTPGIGGAGMQALGYYTLTHSVTGLTMLGSTAAGASAAGTVGIIGGTGGLIGSAAAIAMAPATLIGGAAAVTAGGAYEGACYFFGDTQGAE